MLYSVLVSIVPYRSNQIKTVTAIFFTKALKCKAESDPCACFAM